MQAKVFLGCKEAYLYTDSGSSQPADRDSEAERVNSIG